MDLAARRLSNFQRKYNSRRHLKNLRLKEEKMTPFEKYLLQLKVPLRNGFIGEVVSVMKVKREWRYTCHVCSAKVLKWFTFVRHCRSNAHLDKLKKPVHSKQKFVLRYPMGEEAPQLPPRPKKHPLLPLPAGQARLSSQPYNTTAHNAFASNDCNQYDEDEERFFEYTRTNDKIEMWQHYKEKALLIEADVLKEMAHEQNPDNKNYRSAREFYWERRTEELMRKGDIPANYNIEAEFLEYWNANLKQKFQDIFRKEKAQLRSVLYNQLNGQHSLSVSLFDKKNTGSDYMSDRPNWQSEPDVSVIYVLRSLSVFEDQLGTLGPKIIDLLSQAVLLERSSTSADSLLMSQENFLLLETVKQKLIGILQIGLMKPSTKHVVGKIICDITDLLLKRSNTFDKNSSYDEQELPHRIQHQDEGPDEKSMIDKRTSNDNSEPFTRRIFKVSEILQFIKNLQFLSDLSYIEQFEMSQTIASSLLLRHRNDITEDDLMKEINAYLQNRSEDKIFVDKQYWSSSNQYSSDDVSLTYPSRNHRSEVYETSDHRSSYKNYHDYSSYQQTTKSYYPSSYRSTGSSTSTAVTGNYSLNTDHYRSISLKKY